MFHELTNQFDMSIFVIIVLASLIKSNFFLSRFFQNSSLICSAPTLFVCSLVENFLIWKIEKKTHNLELNIKILKRINIRRVFCKSTSEMQKTGYNWISKQTDSIPNLKLKFNWIYDFWLSVAVYIKYY